MNDSLRLYLESTVRLATAAEPKTMSVKELIGVVGLLPIPAVGYADWVEKTGIGKEKEEESAAPNVSPEELNDQFIEHFRLMGLKSNG